MGLTVTTGQVAIGKDKFFERKEIISEFWTKIENGNNILISAPRRVGKSSIIRHIESNPISGYKAIYITTEPISDENDFFKRIFDVLSEKIAGIPKNLELTVSDVTLKYNNDTTKLDYYDIVLGILENLKKEYTLIIMIDEFAQTVQNINKNISCERAVHFMQKNRELRQTLLHKKIYFVYAGSIGLMNIAKKIGSDTSINDLHSIEIRPLSRKAGKMLIEQLTCSLETKFAKDVNEYILNKIEYLIPYYIQIFIDEINKYCIREEIVKATNETVEIIFEKLIDSSKDYFVHWKERLYTAFDNECEVNFVFEILNYISKNSDINLVMIKEIAAKHDLKEYKISNIISSLEHDGYITYKNYNEKTLRFLSPILKAWWYRNVTLYY